MLLTVASFIFVLSVVVLIHELGHFLVAKLNGISPRRRNFRHGSIAARVDYVGWLLAEGLGARAFDRRIRRIKVLVWVLFALGLLSWLAPV